MVGNTAEVQSYGGNWLIEEAKEYLLVALTSSWNMLRYEH